MKNLCNHTHTRCLLLPLCSQRASSQPPSFPSTGGKVKSVLGVVASVEHPVVLTPFKGPKTNKTASVVTTAKHTDAYTTVTVVWNDVFVSHTERGSVSVTLNINSTFIINKVKVLVWELLNIAKSKTAASCLNLKQCFLLCVWLNWYIFTFWWFACWDRFSNNSFASRS